MGTATGQSTSIPNPAKTTTSGAKEFCASIAAAKNEEQGRVVVTAECMKHGSGEKSPLVSLASCAAGDSGDGTAITAEIDKLCDFNLGRDGPAAADPAGLPVCPAGRAEAAAATPAGVHCILRNVTVEPTGAFLLQIPEERQGLPAGSTCGAFSATDTAFPYSCGEMKAFMGAAGAAITMQYIGHYHERCCADGAALAMPICGYGGKVSPTKSYTDDSGTHMCSAVDAHCTDGTTDCHAAYFGGDAGAMLQFFSQTAGCCDAVGSMPEGADAALFAVCPAFRAAETKNDGVEDWHLDPQYKDDLDAVCGEWRADKRCAAEVAKHAGYQQGYTEACGGDDQGHDGKGHGHEGQTKCPKGMHYMPARAKAFTTGEHTGCMHDSDMTTSGDTSTGTSADSGSSSGDHDHDHKGHDHGSAPATTPAPPTPTPPANNSPKPAFTEADLKAAAAKIAAAGVVDTSALLAATAPPTPTPAPAAEGYVLEQQTVQVTEVRAVVAFALSEEEARAPAMQAALIKGAAEATGVDMDKTSISKIGGKPVTTRSRSLEDEDGTTSTDVEFAFESASAAAAQVEDLKKTVKDAGKDGSLVTRVKQSAAEAGVLTAALKAMDPVVTIAPKEEVVKKTKTVAVKADKTLSDLIRSSSDSEAVIGGAVGGAIGGIVVLGAGYLLFKPKAPQPPSGQPISHYKVEEQLSNY